MVWKNAEGQPQAKIKGQSCWGVLRGLESFTQSIYSTKENGYLVRTLQSHLKSKNTVSTKTLELLHFTI